MKNAIAAALWMISVMLPYLVVGVWGHFHGWTDMQETGAGILGTAIWLPLFFFGLSFVRRA